MVVDHRVYYLHGPAFELIGDLLKRPSLLVLDRALDKLLGEAVEFVLSLSSGSTRLSSKRSASVKSLLWRALHQVLAIR